MLALVIAAAAALGGAGLGTAAAHPLDDEQGGCDDFGRGNNNGTSSPASRCRPLHPGDRSSPP